MKLFRQGKPHKEDTNLAGEVDRAAVWLELVQMSVYCRAAGEAPPRDALGQGTSPSP
jgi:hypothetical protein